MFEDLPLVGQVFPLMQQRMATHAAALDDAITLMTRGLGDIPASRLRQLGEAAYGSATGRAASVITRLPASSSTVWSSSKVNDSPATA